MRKFIVLFLLALALLAAGVELSRRAYFYPPIPAPDYPPPRSRAEAWRQDLDYFRVYAALNRPYTTATRAAALALVDGLAEDVEILSDAELKLGLARAVALSANGHSFVRISDLTRSEGRIPLMGRMFDDGYYFLWAAPPYRHLLGAELVTIDGHPIAEVIAAFRPYSGARDSFFRMVVGWYLETPSLVHALGYADSPDGYTLGVRPAGSRTVTRVEIGVAADAVPPPAINAGDLIAPLDLPGWIGLPSQLPRLPFFLAQWEEPFQAQAIEAIDGFYIRYGANSDVGDYSIAAFNKRVVEALSRKSYAVVIVDQRGNGGGDYLRTRRLMTQLPELAGAQTPIYVITGPLTFSAGISSVAFLKAAGGDRVTIIGTEMGDFERMWGETTLLRLPNAQLDLQLATGLHDYRDGCHQFPDCYWFDFFANVAVGSLAPDVPIPATFAAYSAGEDAALEYILERHGSASYTRE